MTQWEVSGCPDAKARQPNGYFSPLACGVLPQSSRHGEQNTGDGEKRRAGKPADAVRQDVEDDDEADDRRGEQQRGQSEQEARENTSLRECLIRLARFKRRLINRDWITFPPKGE